MCLLCFVRDSDRHDTETFGSCQKLLVRLAAYTAIKPDRRNGASRIITHDRYHNVFRLGCLGCETRGIVNVSMETTRMEYRFKKDWSLQPYGIVGMNTTQFTLPWARDSGELISDGAFVPPVKRIRYIGPIYPPERQLRSLSHCAIHRFRIKVFSVAENINGLHEDCFSILVPQHSDALSLSGKIFQRSEYRHRY